MAAQAGGRGFRRTFIVEGQGNAAATGLAGVTHLAQAAYPLAEEVRTQTTTAHGLGWSSHCTRKADGYKAYA